MSTVIEYPPINISMSFVIFSSCQVRLLSKPKYISSWILRLKLLNVYILLLFSTNSYYGTLVVLNYHLTCFTSDIFDLSLSILHLLLVSHKRIPFTSRCTQDIVINLRDRRDFSYFLIYIFHLLYLSYIYYFVLGLPLSPLSVTFVFIS